jgi:hypothetical protein
VHDYPERKVLAITLVRYLCPRCRATWRMLPVFAARMLWRSWPVVEAKTLEPQTPAAPTIPERTVRRWCARLATDAKLIKGVLRERGGAAYAAVATAARNAATRLQLVLAHAKVMGAKVGQRLARLTATIHRLMPGVRVM